MTELPTLSGPTLPPASNQAPKQIVMLLHGVGADGNDLIGLAPYYQKVLPDALFIAPDAPFPYDMAPFGRQWFGLQDRSEPARLKGTQSSAPILDHFIDTTLANYGLSDDKLALVGFSQGTMMSLHVAPRREDAIAGVVAFSGRLLEPELLVDEAISRMPILLVHGDQDDVVPVKALPEAAEALQKANFKEVYAHIQKGTAHGIAPDGLSVALAFVRDKLSF